MSDKTAVEVAKILDNARILRETGEIQRDMMQRIAGRMPYAQTDADNANDYVRATWPEFDGLVKFEPVADYETGDVGVVARIPDCLDISYRPGGESRAGGVFRVGIGGLRFSYYDLASAIVYANERYIASQTLPDKAPPARTPTPQERLIDAITDMIREAVNEKVD